MASRLKLAVLGHVEWLDFLELPHYPQPGEILNAVHCWQEAAGGGAVAAVQLARLGAEVHFFTALGDDDLGRRAAQRLAELGLQVWPAWRPTPQRRAITMLAAQGERTILTLGERAAARGSDELPWERLDDCQGVFITAADRDAIRAARRVPCLVTTSRILNQVLDAEVAVDALVGSANDAGERFCSQELPERVGLRVLTDGERGGSYWLEGQEQRYQAQRLEPGSLGDAYGCGDSFVAGVTFGLASGLSPAQAIELGARCGAACRQGRGPYATQLGT